MLDTARGKAWLFLLGAVLFEVGGTSIMKASQMEGSLLGPLAGLCIMFVLIGLSYYCLALAVRGLPVGVAFAFWEGFGLTLIVLVSVVALGESMNLTRFFALLAVLTGALLVNYGTGHGTADGPGPNAGSGAAQNAPAQEKQAGAR